MRTPRARLRIRQIALATALALSCALGCAPGLDDAQLVYRVTALDGGPPSSEDMMRARSRLDVRLAEAGYERRDVSEFGPDRLRIVLPESAAGRMAQIRALLEKPEGLPVLLAVEGD